MLQGRWTYRSYVNDPALVRDDPQKALDLIWPDGVDQVPSFVGTVVRVKAHGPNSPAGYTASFIAVSQSG